MKKGLLLLFVSVFGLVLLTGCGDSGKKVTCTADMEGEDGKKAGTAEIVAELDDSDKVKAVSATMEFDDADYASQAYGMISLMNAFMEGQEDAVKIDAKLDGKKLTINNFDAYMDSDEETKMIGMTKDDFIKAMESNEEMKASCK